MSVLKNMRGQSGAEFIDTADKIEVFTIEQCSKLPRRFNYTIINTTINLAISLHCNVKSANSIYPRNIHEAQRRRDLLQDAICDAENLGAQIHIIMKITNCISMSIIEQWANLIDYECVLIRGLMRKDASRYSNLSD